MDELGDSACPLCGSKSLSILRATKERIYYACPLCELRFLEPSMRPSPEAERERYLLHENGPDNSGYIEWLRDIAERGVASRLLTGSRVLDYGSGPGLSSRAPALSLVECGVPHSTSAIGVDAQASLPPLAGILAGLGYNAFAWDPYFFPGEPEREAPYDAIACVEVAEHFREPRDSFAHVASLLREGGILALRTLAAPESDAEFLSWWYREDLTHIVFYRERSVEWLASQFGFELVEFDGKALWVLRKK